MKAAMQAAAKEGLAFSDIHSRVVFVGNFWRSSQAMYWDCKA